MNNAKLCGNHLANNLFECAELVKGVLASNTEMPWYKNMFYLFKI